jgi:hypothetical protein
MAKLCQFICKLDYYYDTAAANWGKVKNYE